MNIVLNYLIDVVCAAGEGKQGSGGQLVRWNGHIALSDYTCLVNACRSPD